MYGDVTILRRFFEKVNVSGPIHPELGSACWLWTGATNELGYGLIRYQGRAQKAHRVGWQLAYGEIPSIENHYGTMFVCHKCDNPSCVRPSHLFLGTPRDNVLDMRGKGREPDLYQIVQRGEKNGKSKLTWDDVRAIRQRYARGEETMVQIAEDYPVQKSAIRKIVNKVNWIERPREGH